MLSQTHWHCHSLFVCSAMARFVSVLLVCLAMLRSVCPQTHVKPTKTFDFNIMYVNVTRLCRSKPLLTVNGQYPGPTIHVDEGDNVVVRVTNHVHHNTTIHWHGIRQMRTGWFDGPAYITQCPIQQGHTYTYKFSVDDHRGTLFWHAHASWQRASVHGAFIVRPSLPYPFPKPDMEIPIILGEWWNEDVLSVEAEVIKYGGGPKASATYTINSQPGLLCPCSAQDAFKQTVEQGKTYMLRLINAALNDELFFAIEKHDVTVVEIDAGYIKPIKTTAIMAAPGQTMNLLLTANQAPSTYIMAAHPYATAFVPYDHGTTTAILHYAGAASPATAKLQSRASKIAVGSGGGGGGGGHLLPKIRDTEFANNFTASLRSLNSRTYPSHAPLHVTKRLFFTVGLNLQDCPPGQRCNGYFRKRFSASVNNQSFVRPATAMLQAAFSSAAQNDAVFSADFPERPPREFDFTHQHQDLNLNPEFSTRAAAIPFGASVQIAFQNTFLMGFENHPVHIHGFNFYVVAQGLGNFDENVHAAGFNLVDPPLRNTVGVPSGGWAVIRFVADNPGVWFMHCHLEIHTTWGLAMAFLVKNGHGPSQSLHPPPADLPPC